MRNVRWRSGKSDPHGWREVDESIANSWVEKNDGPFKTLLDQYKYPNRFPELDPEAVLDEALQVMLNPMEQVLQNFQYLMGNRLSWVDVAIFPFIRQFSMVDLKKFEQLPIPAVKKWLNQQLESELFDSVMQKHPTWKD